MSVTARVPEREPMTFVGVDAAVEHARKAAQEVANSHNPTGEKVKGDSIVQWAVTDNLTGAVVDRGLAYPPGHPNAPADGERAAPCAPSVIER